MNPTDPNEEAVFFADWLLPLRQANQRRGISYLKRDHDGDSYWAPVVSRSGGLQKYAADACDAAAQLTGLDEYWARTNEPALRRLLPQLRKLLSGVTAQPSPGRDESVVAEFVYPLY